MKRRVYSLRWIKGSRLWRLVHNWGWNQEHGNKEVLLATARKWCRHVGEKFPCQLRVFGKNGRIQFEHTYPRSSDPKRSKG